MQNHEEEILWYNFNMAEEREMKKAVKWIQKICRNSLEYDLWQGRTKAGHQICPACNEYYGYVPAETHHYPKTMYDICEDVVTTFIHNDELGEQTGFSICTHIMNMHFMGMVEYVVLCKSCHEKFHAGHPEVCTKVNETYLRQKEGKPVNAEEIKSTADLNGEKDQAEKNILKSSGTDLQVKLDLPPAPVIIKTETQVNFINQNGIEIDI